MKIKGDHGSRPSKIVSEEVKKVKPIEKFIEYDIIRGAVHAESQRQTHIQERIRQDTRGMRRKARRADKNHESGDRGDEKGSEERIRKEGRPHISA